MIENIIFDLGNVLISYAPKSFVEKYVKEENRERFYEVVFKSKEWLFNNNIQDVLFPIEKNIEL